MKMIAYMRMAVAILGVGAILATVVAFGPVTGSAANLTGGSYTYVIDGEEVTFAYDPVSRKDGLILPVEVFQRFGINVENPLSRTFSLKKAGEIAKVTLGSTTFELNGQPEVVATAALRLNGRLFVPADLLKHFGVEFSQDGNYVFMSNYVEGQPSLKQVSDTDYDALKMGKTFTANVRADSGVYLSGEFMLLTPQILATDRLAFSYGLRSRLQSLIQTNTVVMVKLSNTSFKAGALVSNGLFLVDDDRNQYDLSSTLDIGRGLITGKLAPSAARTGLLLFPKWIAGAESLLIYYDNNGSTIGTFHSLQ